METLQHYNDRLHKIDELIKEAEACDSRDELRGLLMLRRELWNEREKFLHENEREQL